LKERESNALLFEKISFKIANEIVLAKKLTKFGIEDALVE